MQHQKDKLDKQIAKHQVESIVLLHATALVDVANKSTIPAKDLNVDSIGDRHVGGTAFSVIISEDDNYNGEVTLLHVSSDGHQGTRRIIHCIHPQVRQ